MLSDAGSMVGGHVYTALLLTCMGACGTALGGLVVVAQPDMSFARLGLLQVSRCRAGPRAPPGAPTCRLLLLKDLPVN